MPILDRRTNQLVEDQDTRVSVGIDFPFGRQPNQDGYFKTTKTTVESVKNNIRLLLQTELGERTMQPFLGMNLRQFIFEQITPDTEFAIQDSIIETFNFWLPFVNIKDIKVISNNDYDIGRNEIKISIIFNINKDPNTLESVEVTIGE